MYGLGQTSGWDTFDCPGTSRRWRVDNDGLIEVEGQPYPMRAWPERVNEWAVLISDKAAKYGIPAIWVASIMALETGGRPGLCRKNPDGSCSLREGMGLMAMLRSTASGYAGRPVSIDELLNDHDLQIDLGAKMIADLRSRYDGDYVKVAIAYNAGAVRCGNGSTWERPKEPCPPTPWGVVMGCLRTRNRISSYCAPSTVREGHFACAGDYPQVAIAYYNAALGAGWTQDGLTGTPGPVPGPNGHKPPPGPVPAPVQATMSTMMPFILGGLLGYAAIRWGLPSP